MNFTQRGSTFVFHVKRTISRTSFVITVLSLMLNYISLYADNSGECSISHRQSLLTCGKVWHTLEENRTVCWWMNAFEVLKYAQYAARNAPWIMKCVEVFQKSTIMHIYCLSGSLNNSFSFYFNLKISELCNWRNKFSRIIVYFYLISVYEGMYQVKDFVSAGVY